MRGFVPPPYPYERLAPLKADAEAVPGGLVDCSIGDPCDPVPAPVADALAAAVQSGVRYPPSIGTAQLREAACGWLDRRLGVAVDPAAVDRVRRAPRSSSASLPHHLHLRDPERDTVLHPDVAYPTYEMGAMLGGLRPVPVPADADGRLDLDAIEAGANSLALCRARPSPAGRSSRRSSPGSRRRSRLSRPGA